MRSLKFQILAGVFSVATLGVTAASADTITVTGASPDGWSFSNTDNSGRSGTGAFVNGPATPPLGNGSAQLTVGDAGSSENLTQVISPTLLSSFTNLSYSTFVTNSTAGSGSAPNLEFDLFNRAGTYEGRLVFDPGVLLSVVDGEWQTWNATSETGWYFSHPALSTLDGGDCSLSGNYCSFADASAFLDGQGIEAYTNLFKLGSGQASANTNVDAYTVNGTTYNFEATAVPEPVTMSIFGAGLVGAAAMRRRRNKKSAQNS